MELVGVVEFSSKVRDAVTSLTVYISARASIGPSCGMRAARVTDAKGAARKMERNMLSRWRDVHEQEKNMSSIQAPYKLPRCNSYILTEPNLF